MNAAKVFTQLPVKSKPDPSRTVIRPFGFDCPPAFAEGRPTRRRAVVGRLIAFGEEERDRLLARLSAPMRDRHDRPERTFLRRYDELAGALGDLATGDPRDRQLIGAYCGEEYAFGSAALFNPSVVQAPNVHHTPDGRIRPILTLRGIGEGHISSVTLSTGSWDGDRVIDPPSPRGVPPVVESDDDAWVCLTCPDSESLSETVIFPVLPIQRQSVEDMRLVAFTDDDRRAIYGTFTAFDGRDARTELIRAIDLRTFEIRALTGAMAGDKGMALFPVGSTATTSCWGGRTTNGCGCSSRTTFVPGRRAFRSWSRAIPGSSSRWAIAVRRSSSTRVAGADPRRRDGPQLLHRRVPVRQGRPVARAGAHRGAAAHSSAQ